MPHFDRPNAGSPGAFGPGIVDFFEEDAFDNNYIVGELSLKEGANSHE
jgi:hypothetical protein